MRILLYGGSFDPPHYGHLNNLRAAAARVCPDRVVVMPAGVSPFKQGTSAPGPLRVEMCGCFAELAREMGFGLEVSGWEVEQAEQGRKNYSVLTLEKLARENPGDELYLAIGSDMLLSFDGWHRWEDILRLAHLVVTSRNVGDDPALHAKARQLDASGARILFAPVEAADSTDSSVQAETLRKGWAARGVTFSDGGCSMISVVFHDRFSETENTLFIGHVGVLLPAGDDGLYFVEKVAFQEPYRLTKFESRAALKSYLMAKYDTGWGQDTTPPFLMENDVLMDGEAAQ